MASYGSNDNLAIPNSNKSKSTSCPHCGAIKSSHTREKKCWHCKKRYHRIRHAFKCFFMSLSVFFIIILILGSVDLEIDYSYYEDSIAAINQNEFLGFHQFTSIELGTHIDNALIALGSPTSTMSVDILGTESTTKSWWTVNFFRLPTSETETFTNGYATSVMSTADASSNIAIERNKPQKTC